MCGLNGIYAYNPSANRPGEKELLATRDAMTVRGPDGAGLWWNEDRRLGLGHRRLSIIDLSDAGAQPMHSTDGRLVVVFNGEIYNYPELRRELEALGASFVSNSDTEILLHLYERQGETMLQQLRGMFAMAIWDNAKRTLFLARDPYGIKPIYTANDGWSLRFASQVKALLAGGKISRDPEPAGIVGFHLWGSVPEPFTLYRDIRALPAGHFQWVDETGPREPKAYANIAAAFRAGADAPVDKGAVNALVRTATADSVRAHLLADVEVGLFLSAGVDSGALLGLMRDAGQERVRAITLAFDEFTGTEDDEAPLAAEIARHYGAEHVVRRVAADEFERDLPAILEAMDQPSIDGVNSWFIAKAASWAGLKVALSGLGGDELLAGYPSFRQIPQWVRLMRVPAAVPGLGKAARVIGSALGFGKSSPKALGMLEYGGSYIGAYLLQRGLFLPFELKTVLDAETLHIGLRRLKPLARLREQALTPDPAHRVSRVAALESCAYMRNQLLRDCDWAGMAHSLEIRTPLVDADLLKLLVPATAVLSASAGKAALAAAPSKPLPASITDRPKSGFAVPTGHWMDPSRGAQMTRGAASRAWALDVIGRPSARRQAFSAPRAVQA